MPLISIILTSFNYGNFIREAINSVLNQTFQNWELLIVDDCSTDDSWAIIQSFDDPRIKTHRHTVNLGACAAYNQALSIAQGDYIACLDSDDLFMPTKLERQLAFFVEHPEVDVCGTFVTENDSNGVVISNVAPYADWFNVSIDLNDPAQWLWANHLCHSGAIVRKAVHERIGEFDNKLIYTPDWQFWLRALTAGAHFAVIHETLVGYRNHGNNVTHKNRRAAVLEHAETCATFLFPWLQRQNREDLIEQTMQGFVRNPELADPNGIQTSEVKCLFSGISAVEVGATIIRIAIRREIEFTAKEMELAEILRTKEWLASQRDEWEKTAGEREQSIAALQLQVQDLITDNAWLALQREACEKTADEREQSIAALQVQAQDLLTSNAWLASQREACEKTADEREQSIAALQVQAQDLLTSNAWLASQREAWEKTADEREQSIAALQVQAQDLLTSNAWLASQREAWEKTGNEREQSIVALTIQLHETDKRLACSDATLNKICNNCVMRFVNFLSKSKFF